MVAVTGEINQNRRGGTQQVGSEIIGGQYMLGTAQSRRCGARKSGTRTLLLA